MSVFFDLIIVVAALIFLWLGFKKGFFKSITDLIVMILSVLVPYLFAPELSEHYYNKFVYNDLVSKINDILNQNIGLNNSAKNILGLIGNIPDFFKSNSLLQGVTVNDILKALNSSGDRSLIIADLLKPSILKVITIIMFAVLTIITFTVLKLLFKFALKLPRIPIFGLIDSILGLCMGALKFAVFTVIFVAIFIAALLIIPQNVMINDINDAINNSQIFKSVYKINVDVLNDYLKLN